MSPTWGLDVCVGRALSPCWFVGRVWSCCLLTEVRSRSRPPPLRAFLVSPSTTALSALPLCSTQRAGCLYWPRASPGRCPTGPPRSVLRLCRDLSVDRRAVGRRTAQGGAVRRLRLVSAVPRLP